MSDNLGTYWFINSLPYGSNFTLTPAKDDNPLNGITTYDLVLISKHILGIKPLGSPYKMIAADANKSNSITTFDIDEIRKLILGIYQSLPGNDSWRFIDNSYVFPNPSNPFQEMFPENKSVADMQANMFDANFTAVKIGDVNNTVVPNSLLQSDDRSVGTLLLDVADRDVKAGESFDLTFKTSEEVAAFQLTLNLDGLSVVEIQENDKVSANNFGVFNDALTVSLDAANDFTVNVVANKPGKLSDMLSVSNRITKAQAYKSLGNLDEVANWDVALRFNGTNGSFVSGTGYELLQNVPNPVQGLTNISFNLPASMEATLTISNADGRVLKTLSGSYEKGLNTVTIHRAELDAGVLFYTLNTADYSATKKMIIVE